MKIPFNDKINLVRQSRLLQRQVELILNIVLIMIMLLLCMYPTFVDIQTISTHQKDINAILSQSNEKLSSLSAAEKLVANTQSSFGLFEDAFPIEPKQFSLINTLRIAAEQRFLDLEEITHRFAQVGVVEFTATGRGTYTDIVEYVAQIEQLPRLVNVSTVDLKVSVVLEDVDTVTNPVLVFTISGQGYYYEDAVSLLEGA